MQLSANRARRAPRSTLLTTGAYGARLKDFPHTCTKLSFLINFGPFFKGIVVVCEETKSAIE